jgi:uncharacterized protein (TIGR03118 family)
MRRRLNLFRFAGHSINNTACSKQLAQFNRRSAMSICRAARSGVIGMVCAIFLMACGGGGYGSGSSSMPSSVVSIAVNPATINAGQSATLSWSSTAGTACTASGAWNGNQAASGTQIVTPAAGTQTYSLSCSGGGYSSASSSATLTVNAATAFSLTNLIADTAGGTATNVDAHLVNPWGLSIPAGTAPAWVANNHSGTSALYDGNGKAQPAAGPLLVNFAASATNVSFDPTGIVFNAKNTDFIVTAGTLTGAARFIFAGEGGMLAGWSPTVDATHAINMYTAVDSAVYKGLAIASNNGSVFLYAADFHNNKIDVFNASFARQATSATVFTFVDPNMPAGYAPFGIQALANGAAGAIQLYVTYAKQQAPDNFDNENGAGLGYVDIYGTNGQLIKRLVSAGLLNAPWGITLAPADFGTLSNALLVGNFGDGKINGYDAASGAFIGTIKDAGGTALATPGLWGIAFGNDANNQPHNTLFFAAGTNDEANGSYGRLDVGATPPVLNPPPVVTLAVPAGNLQNTVALSATVQAAVNIAGVKFLANNNLIGTATTSPYTVNWDSTTVANGVVSIKAIAIDVNGNVGSSAASNVTVANNPPATVTLTQLQTQIFTPICSGCHTGVGSTLPGAQNLTAGNTFTNIVGVASLEQPALQRIKPNDAANSYLLQKIEGAAGITGARMPLGCGPAPATACLDQATIDKVKAWVSQGALNN